MRGLYGIQKYIQDPEVLAAVITAQEYHVAPELSVQPERTADIIKQGKSPAAESIAPVVTDSKLLTKLARDQRKGVRRQVIKNPLITQDDLELTLRRSLKNDADTEVAAPTVKLMDSDRALPILAEYSTTLYTHKFGTTVAYSGLDLPRTYGYGGCDVMPELCRRIPIEGVDYLKALHEAGIEDYIFRVRRYDTHDNWYTPGMLTWMAPEMRDELVPLFLAELVSGHAEVSIEDVHTVREVIERTENLTATDDVQSRSANVSPKLDDETLRAIYDLGPVWQKMLRRAPRLPEDLQEKFVLDLPFDELSSYAPQTPPAEFTDWKPEADPDSSESLPEYFNWQAPGVVNIIADRWYDQMNAEADQAAGELGPYRWANTGLLQLVTSVHPARRRALSPQALLLAAWQGSSRYLSHGISLGYTPLKDWLAGNLDDKPSAEKIAELAGFTRKVQGPSGVRNLMEAIATTRRVSYLLGDTLEAGEVGADAPPAVTYLVFQHYLGNDPEAWTVALDLAHDWSDGLEELAITASAATGLDIPEEVVDLPDLEAAEEAAQEDVSEEEPEAADNQDVDPAPEVEEPLENVEESSEPTEDHEDPSEEESEGSEEGDDDTEEEPEDGFESLDITKPVMYTLF